jgi:N-carbamoylputrescine amidase
MQVLLRSDGQREAHGVVPASFDLDAIRNLRAAWGLFRDRRSDLYGTLLTSDGKTEGR